MLRRVQALRLHQRVTGAWPGTVYQCSCPLEGQTGSDEVTRRSTGVIYTMVASLLADQRTSDPSQFCPSQTEASPSDTTKASTEPTIILQRDCESKKVHRLIATCSDPHTRRHWELRELQIFQC